jgi:hypothetical protein
MRGKLGALLLLMPMVLGLLPSTALGASSGIPCRHHALSVLKGKRDEQMDTVQIRTLHIEAKPVAKSYKIGKTAKVAVTVTRPSGEDPFGNGIPIPSPTSVPASDIYVGIGVNLGDVFLPAFGVTDAEGKVTVDIKLRTYAVPGKAQVSVYAYHTDVDTACMRLEENGFQKYKDMFRVTR